MKKREFQTWHGILIGGIVLVAMILSIVQKFSIEEKMITIEAVLTPETCELSGGNWVECGSACLDSMDGFCTMNCVSYCECDLDSQCPSGMICEHHEVMNICSKP